MLGNALPPAGRPLGADAAQAPRRIVGEGDQLAQLVGRFDPRNHHAVGPDIERSLHKADVALGEPHQRDRVAANRGPQVLDDFLPIEVAVLGIDDDPIHAERDGHFRDAGALERHPHAVHGLVRRQLLRQFFDCGRFHALGDDICGASFTCWATGFVPGWARSCRSSLPF